MASPWKSTKRTADVGIELGEDLIGFPKWIVDGRHVGAALQIDDGERRAAFGLARVDALTGDSGGEVRRPQQARLARVIVVDVLLVEAVIAAGKDVCAEREQFFGDLRGDAEASGGIFGVGDDEVNVAARCGCPAR